MILTCNGCICYETGDLRLLVQPRVSTHGRPYEQYVVASEEFSRVSRLTGSMVPGCQRHNRTMTAVGDSFITRMVSNRLRELNGDGTRLRSSDMVPLPVKKPSSLDQSEQCVYKDTSSLLNITLSSPTHSPSPPLAKQPNPTPPRCLSPGTEAQSPTSSP